MLAIKPCAVATAVNTAAELDSVIREALALRLVHNEDESPGTLSVVYSDESVKNAKMIPLLEAWGVEIVWHKNEELAVVQSFMHS